MHAPPEIRGGLPARLATLVLGLFICAVGTVAFLEAELGLPPWDVLHQGVATRLGISFGLANILVSAAVLALAASLRARIGIGTVANATLIGTFVILLFRIDGLSDLSDAGLATRIAYLPFALLCFGSGSALYIAASLGAGPRDSLMLVLSRRVGIRIGWARTAIEILALAAGFALGGTAGIGTLVFALGIGPAVELSFWLLERTPVAGPGVASPPVMETGI